MAEAGADVQRHRLWLNLATQIRPDYRGVMANRGENGQLACSDMTGATPDVGSRGRCDRGEVHFLQEGLEAGVGAEGVVDEQLVEMDQLTVAFVNGPLQPRDSLIAVLKS